MSTTLEPPTLLQQLHEAYTKATADNQARAEAQAVSDFGRDTTRRFLQEASSGKSGLEVKAPLRNCPDAVSYLTKLGQLATAEGLKVDARNINGVISVTGDIVSGSIYVSWDPVDG